MTATKLILFDIDGTLTRSHRGFIPFNEAILKTFGLAGDIRQVIPDGKTDPVIVEEIFAAAHLKVEITEQRWQSFITNLHESFSSALRDGRAKIVALPGVLGLVDALAKVDGVCQGIVTGNLEVTAQLKLTAAGLGSRLNLGAYGSDSRRRVDLPRIARERWERRLGKPIAPADCVVVGDTPQDLEAARQNAMKCLLVGTGRYPVEELEFFRPDACLPDLTQTKDTVEAVLKLI